MLRNYMQECATCKVKKENSEFNLGPRKELRIHCKVCQRQSDRDKYHNRSPEQRAKDKVKRRASLNKNREWIRAVKDKPCLDCSQKFHFFVMDFDHRDPSTKSFDVGTGATQGLSLRALEQEVAKCDLVCSNCHRMRTYSRMMLSSGEA